MMNERKLKTANDLAKAHRENEPRLQYVHLLESQDENHEREPIKLLEVVEGTLERGVEPIAFPANPGRGIEYPVLIIEVSPKEYEHIRSDAAVLKAHGWTIGSELPAV